MIEQCEIDYRHIGKAQYELGHLEREAKLAACNARADSARQAFWDSQVKKIQQIKRALTQMRIDVLGP